MRITKTISKLSEHNYGSLRVFVVFAAVCDDKFAVFDVCCCCIHASFELQTLVCTRFENSSVRWEPSLVGFFDEHEGYSQLSGYSVRLNFCSLPCLQDDFLISPTIFTRLLVIRSWFVIFPWFAESSWKNKFSEHIREHNVCKCIRSFRYL